MKKNEAYDVFYTLRDNLGLSGQGWDPVVPEENEQDRRRVSWSVKLVKKRNLGQAFNIPRIVSKVVAEYDLLMKVDATDERPTLRLVSAEYEVRELTDEETHRKQMSGQLRAALNYKARDAVENLLDEYESIEEIAVASEAELREVDRIGETRARELQMLEAPSDSDSTPSS